MQVGFIGLGIVGHPMAGHLAAGGHQLFVFGGRRMPEDSACANGGQAWDHSGMVRVLEMTAGHEIGQSAGGQSANRQKKA